MELTPEVLSVGVIWSEVKAEHYLLEIFRAFYNIYLAVFNWPQLGRVCLYQITPTAVEIVL